MTASSTTPSCAAAAGRPSCSQRWKPPMPDRGAGSWAEADHRAEAGQRASLSGLLARATDRVPLDGAPGKSGAEMERLMIDGQPYVLKRLDLARDWTLRASGCLPGPPLVLWQRGVLDHLPGCINQPIVAVAGHAAASTRPSGGCLLLMRDVSP